MSDETFKSIPREVCPECSRPTNGYYDRRAQHMAAAYRSGVPAQTIAKAYYVSGEWAMKIITEQLGKEEVLAVQATYWETGEEE
jgi:hypothetical protein